LTGQGTSDNAAIQTHRDIVSGVKEKALCAKPIWNPGRRRAEMKDKTICKIFCAIAYQAMKADLEIVLEKGKDKSKSSSMNGFLTNSEIDRDSLRLHIFKPNDKQEDEEDQEEDQEETC